MDHYENHDDPKDAAHLNLGQNDNDFESFLARRSQHQQPHHPVHNITYNQQLIHVKSNSSLDQMSAFWSPRSDQVW